MIIIDFTSELLRPGLHKILTDGDRLNALVRQTAFGLVFH
jgi:hypothetical protein